MITSFIEKDHRDWDLHLDEFHFAYNTAVHSSLKVSPAYLNSSRDLRTKNESRRKEESLVIIREPNTKNWTNRMTQINELRDLVKLNLDLAHELQKR